MKRIRALAAGMLVFAVAGLVVAPAQAAAQKKIYTTTIEPDDVTASTTATFTATLTNKTSPLATQRLGSANITPPAGFTLVATGQPIVLGVQQGSAQIVNNVLQLRSMAIPAQTSGTVTFQAAVPGATGTYLWQIVARQSNNFNPDTESNRFTLDAANSDRSTNVNAPPGADLGVSQTESQDPVVGNNAVHYFVTVSNGGPVASGPVTLDVTQTNGATITAISGSGWTCGTSGSSASCSTGSLDPATSAPVVDVSVLAPDVSSTVVITNTATVSQTGVGDPDGANNSDPETTTVEASSSCAGAASCGSGTIDYSQPSSVTTGTTSSATAFLVGTAFLPATASTGTQIYSMLAPLQPDSLCPVDFGSSELTDCDFQMNMDPVPAAYADGITLELTCHVSRCPEGLVPGAGIVLVKVGDGGQRTIIPTCASTGGEGLCYDASRVDGNLRLVIQGITPGDPRIGGRCIAGC